MLQILSAVVLQISLYLKLAIASATYLFCIARHTFACCCIEICCPCIHELTNLQPNITTTTTCSMTDHMCSSCTLGTMGLDTVQRMLSCQQLACTRDPDNAVVDLVRVDWVTTCAGTQSGTGELHTNAHKRPHQDRYHTKSPKLQPAHTTKTPTKHIKCTHNHATHPPC